MQQEILIQMKAETTKKISANKSLKRFVSCFVFSGLILFGIKAAAQPVVSSLSAVVGVPGAAMTITGSGFNATPANNIVYFGGMQATVTGGSATSLSVTVPPRGVTYSPLTVLNTGTQLQGWSPTAFLPTFTPVGYASNAITFDTMVNFPAVSGASGIAIGDMNGDGYPDVVVGLAGSKNVEVYINNGAAPGPATSATRFSSVVVIPTSISVYFVSLADIDGDGKLDIAIGEQGPASTVATIHNASASWPILTPTFGAVTYWTSGTLPYIVRFGDLDGDGRPEMVVANNTANSVTIFRNTSSIGTIAFGGPTVVATGSSPVDVAIQDIDGDGKRDMVVASAGGTGQVAVFRNTTVTAGTYLFAISNYPTPVSVPEYIVIGDVDGDGKADVSVGSKNGATNKLMVYLNHSVSGTVSMGTTAAPATSLPNGSFPAYPIEGMVGADFDGDGLMDIAATNLPDTMVTIYHNVSTVGTASFVPCYIKSGYSPSFTAAGDLDGDGLPDLVVTNYSALSNSWSFFRNDPLTAIAPHQICASGTDSVQFTEATSGGTWTSGCALVIVDTFSGYVKGNGSGLGGTCTITYNKACGYITSVVTVNASPTGITGGHTVCIGTQTTLNGIPAGGSFGSYSVTVATVGAATGVVTGVSPGLDTISYYIGLPTCKLLTTVNVFNPPAAITGSLNVCVGLTTQLTDASTPGTWNMVNGNATITGGGLVTGVNGSTTDSVYFTQTSTTCRYGALVTVNPLPGVINGTPVVCAGLPTQLTDATAGGTWSSSDITVATVTPGPGPSGGLVTGVNTVTTTSTAVITYTLPTGCITTVVVTVNPNPTAILGNLNVCVGLTTTLTDASGPGTWTSASTGVATIGSASGIALGVSGAAGGSTDLITYKLNGTGCQTTAVLTVYPTPAVITGTLTVCQNATTQLTDATAGGTWSSSNPLNGSINTTGLVTGLIGSTTTTITYTSANGCASPTVVVTINPLPGVINGSGSVCVGSSITLTDAPAGGTWTSSNPLAGTIGSASGVLTGVGTGGLTNITYTIASTGCSTSSLPLFTVTVNPLPAAITGGNTVCVGQMTALTDATAGGTWSASNGNASVDGSGNVTGNTGSTTDVISYTLPTTCAVTRIVSINPLPTVISGASSVCVGSSITLSDGVPGGTWTLTPPGIATIVAGPSATTTVTGTGAAGGTVTVTYTVGTGCFITTIVSVNPVPAAITGTPSVCIGQTTALTDLTPGGNWTSSAAGSASVVGGVVTGVTCPTTPYISYTLPGTGCYAVMQVTVNCLPNPISGTASVCVGLTTTLSSSPGTGTWSISPLGIASVTAGPSGTTTVTGIAAGTAIVTYTLPTGCINTIVVTVNANPTAINGTLTVCVGLTTQLTDGTVGGTWSSGTTAVGTIASGTGVLYGVGSGTTIVTYVLNTGCLITAVATVNPNPTAILGTFAVCQGLSTTLSDLTGGGSWSAGNGNVTIGSGTGVVTGVVCPATSPITYTLPTGCINTATETINCNPAPINGTLTVCIGSTTQLTDATLGGTWTSSNPLVGSISTTGLVTGLIAGTTNITYTGPTGGCIGPVVTVTVNALPTPIFGTRIVCQGQTTQLTDGTGGGGWTINPTTTATIDPTGLVTGVNGGAAGSGSYNTAITTYTLGTGCIVTAVVTVNPLPAPITGPTPLAVCVGSTITLTSSPAGGTWTSTNPGTGSVSTTGVVTGINGGSFPPGWNPTNIIYTGPNGCSTASAGAIVTVNANPTAILGASAVCVGSTITLSDAVGGGSWSSSAPGNGSVDATGDVTGVFGGATFTTTIITYMLPTTCIITKTVTINPLPAAISGTLTVCVGLTTALTDTTAGGTWSSSNPFIGSVSTSGVVTGISAGNTTITDMLSTGCYVTTVVTVNPLPTAILGNNSVCVGSTTSLSDATPGGNWSSVCADMSISGTGLVTGLAQGTCNVTYTLLGTGCIATQIVTINPLPTAILGNLSICVGSSSLLTDATLFGTWTSNPSANVNIGFGTGLATGLIASTNATITYTLPTGCIATAIATVNPLPTAINGTFAVCQGLCTTLTDATPGGSWSSQNPTDATAGSGTGLVCGVTGFSTTTITYTLPTTCFTVQQITVNALPTAINGNLNVCQGLTTQLTDATPGGTWSSSLPGNGSIDPSTGIATGLIGGTTTTITYTLSTGCNAYAVLTINSLPTSILGNPTVCSGLTTQLSDLTAGGSWSSSNPFVASVGPGTGLVTGVATVLSTATITYTMPSSCYITTTVTVYPLPSAINGVLTVCSGSTTTLTDASPGGTWSSSAPLAGSIDPVTGVVTGGFAGTTTITYTLGTGCIITTVVTVNPLPTAILGNLSVCIGATTQLSDATLGGSWAIAPTSIATVIAATGAVTGVSTGAAIVTYTLPTTCSITATVNVNPNPTPILPPSPQVCVGSTIILSDATAGGSWSGSNSFIGTVGAGSGAVTGINAGIFIDTYTLPTTCYTFTLVTVNALPAAISGTLSVCQGLCTTLTDATPGGTWTSGNVTDATVGSTSGLVCGINGGLAGTTDPITYTLTSTGCFVTATMNINPIPGAINGVPMVCVGLTTQLTDASAGVSWSSSDPTIASINPGTGLVTGVAAGVVTITTQFATGCQATMTLTVNPNPAPITGTFVLCQGSTVSLADATPGGTWSSSNPGVASISATGLVTGASGGTTTDTYTLATGCIATQVVTVNPLPSPIVGAPGVCVGSSTPLADITGGGVWSSSNVLIGSVDATGNVTGESAGIVYISYTLPAGCYVTHVMNVSTTPPPITGTTSICTGSTVLLTDLLAGGTWSSGNPAVATIDPFGVTSGNGAGTATITYLPPSGCLGTTVVTVYATPATPTGSPLAVCVGLSITLADGTPGGTWTSSAVGIATVTPTTGIVTGVSGGTAVISYTMPSYCYATVIVTVNNNPTPINGSSTVCLFSTTVLEDGSGGTWSTQPGTGSVLLGATGASTVSVTGQTVGTCTVIFTSGSGCFTTLVMTVEPLPATISGTLTMCAGASVSLSDISPGGTWSSIPTSVATVGSTGIVTGVAAGTATIAYATAGGCASSVVVTVNALPLAITGNTAVCKGFTTQLTDATTGGTWSSSSPGNASVGSTTGLVTGVTGGSSATITYTSAAGCITTILVTVNLAPAPINGNLTICVGGTTTLTDATSFGHWGSTTPSVATINLFTGVVNGLGAGTTIDTFSINATGCYVTAVVTVNANPSAILGNLNVCIGSTTQLSDATGGGIWSISNADATIGSAGLVTGVTAGTATVSYTSASSCFITAIVTVDALPAPITGTLAVCVGLTTTLSDATAGGTWTSSNTAVSPITLSTGVAFGGSAGTATDTYTIAHGCYVTAIVTVNPNPTAILGNLTVCLGLTTALTDAATGGTWASSAPSIAPVSGSTGVVTGSATGTATETYTLPTGCLITAVVTVNPLPLAINGTLALCSGTSTTLTDGTTGGLWTSGTPSVATINAASGLLTGVASGGGTTTITYTLGTGCIATAVVTVYAVPAPISGPLTVCVGSTTNLTDASLGGLWFSSIPPLASVVSSTGVVSGLSVGTVVITYLLPSPTGCQTTAVLTVNPVPAPITGPMTVCLGLTATLTDATAGGAWSATGAILSGGSASGLIFGNSVGTGTLTVTLPATGCASIAIITVNPLPATITGNMNVCIGLTTTLSDASAGGTWSSSLPAVATVTSGGGVVTGVTTGTATITYTLATGCIMTTIVTVNPLPTAILGATRVCVTASTTLSDLTGGGTWSSSDNTIAIVGSLSGIVTGVLSGTATISYTIPTGCYATLIMTVEKVPAAITGTPVVCVGLTTALSDATPGGTWSSSSPTIGTVGTATGIVMGEAGGTTTITYSVAASCQATAIVTVNPLPVAISGSLSLCSGLSSTLSDGSGGGTWSSSNTAVATIGTSTGVVNAIAIGTSTITYTLSTGCIITAVVTVHPNPVAISGANKVCFGSSITLSDVTPGGVWTSSNSAIASVSSAGVVTGSGVGTATISYSPAVGCSALQAITVNALPNVFTVFGGGTYCQGGSGVPIGLNGSNVGVSYLLFVDSSAWGFLAGTGDTLHFGSLTMAGTYSVLATGSTTGCSIGMTSTATVVITPTVNPTVTLHASPADTVCPGTTVTVTPTLAPLSTGTVTPTYVWYVNGTAVSTSPTYVYIPANGDIVKVVATSGAVCIFPISAMDTLKIHVLQNGTPTIHISVDPGDTVCQYATAMFTATSTFGGTSPVYKWVVNNVAVGGPGSAYSYVPNSGDVVYCKLTSNYMCANPDTAHSNLVHMDVVPMIIPHVEIIAHPGLTVVEDSTELLTTVVTGAGADPTYQWEINGIPVSGATNSSYSSNSFHNYDSVTCVVTSSGYCQGISTFDWVYITIVPTGVGSVQYVGVSNIILIPNPNTGAFNIKGSLATTTDEDLAVEVTDMLGQVIYKKQIRSDNGKVNQQIDLGNNLANGMYILNISGGNENKSFHFVVER